MSPILSLGPGPCLLKQCQSSGKHELKLSSSDGPLFLLSPVWVVHTRHYCHLANVRESTFMPLA